MRVAILSDIHGNLIALNAVLKDLERQGNADHIVVTGDMFAFGSAPGEVLALLQQLPRARFLLGNTDRYLLERSYPSAPNGSDWQAQLLLSFHWTAERLGGDGFRFLRGLPSSQLIQEGPWQLLAVHGSPRSDEEGLTGKTAAEEFEEMPIGPQVRVVACGHTHVPMDRTVRGVRVVNVGSVGLPFDGDPRACYALILNLTGNGASATQVTLRRVTYDVEKAVEHFYAVNHPAADISAYNLRTARSLGSSLIYTPEMRHHHDRRPLVSERATPDGVGRFPYLASGC